MADLDELLQRLCDTPAMRAKLAIQQPAAALAGTSPLERQARYALPGDDTAAIACGDGYQLLAMEGMLPAFVQAAPWFAGWSAVMANVSDIAAMGGRATAVVNAYWHHDSAAAEQLLAGMHAACTAYGLVMAGGHTSLAAGNPAMLAVAITGMARTLLSTWHVAPGQVIAMATDLDGTWHEDTAYWKAFEGSPGERLRAKLDVLPRLAEAQLLLAAKDISNAGILGSLLMLLEPTGCGAHINLASLPIPAGADLERWLQVFPSYGFVMTLAAADFSAVQAAFAFEGVACECIGSIDDSGRMIVESAGQLGEFWNLRTLPFTGFGRPAHPQETP